MYFGNVCSFCVCDGIIVLFIFVVLLKFCKMGVWEKCVGWKKELKWDKYLRKVVCCDCEL